MVSEGDIVVFKRKKVDIETCLKRHFKTRDGSYDYLLHIKTYMYTEEAADKLEREAKHAAKELDVLKTTPVVDIWLNNI